ncbi:MAG: glycosyltransferase family 4 protein [Brevefilum sp.]
MKIVCIAASFIPANTANSIQVIKASQALAELGHEVSLLVPGDEAPDWNELKEHYGLRTQFEIRWISENTAFRRYDFALKAVQEARRMEPDLVYTWVLQAGVLALWRMLPVVLELHDRVTGRIGPWLFKRFWAAKAQKRVLTNTTALRRLIISEFDLKVQAEQIRVAPNGVDLERYQELPNPSEARKKLDLPGGFTAGYTGHFYAGRGMNLMLELAKALPEIQFLWVGGEPADVTLWEYRVRENGVKNLMLTGFVDNSQLPIYQAAADVLLMPYETQIAGSGGGDSADIASPMKMFEYLAAGRPIISSDLPVIHEVLDEKTAIFCPPGDFDAWKCALLDLLDDPGRGNELAQASRKLAENYTWRARAEKALEDFL